MFTKLDSTQKDLPKAQRCDFTISACRYNNHVFVFGFLDLMLVSHEGPGAETLRQPDVGGVGRVL